MPKDCGKLNPCVKFSSEAEHELEMFSLLRQIEAQPSHSVRHYKTKPVNLVNARDKVKKNKQVETRQITTN